MHQLFYLLLLPFLLLCHLCHFGFSQTSYAMPTDHTNNINEFNFLEFINPSGESSIVVSGFGRNGNHWIYCSNYVCSMGYKW